MYGYHYKPDVIFFGCSKYYYGLEIELDNCGIGSRLDELEYCNVCNKYKKYQERRFAYLKYDGSLRNGVEIVTMPGSLAFWRNSLADLQAAIDFVAECYDADVYDSCGLHIHVSRTAFTDRMHIVRLSNLVTRMYDVLLAIVQRDPDCAEEYAAPNGINKSYDTLAWCHRYHAINITNEKTVEFRLPASTTDAERVVGYIELFDWLIQYSRETDELPIGEDAREDLLNAIPAKYKYLREIIKSTNFISE